MHKVSTSKEAAEPLSQHYLSQGGFPKKIPEKKKFSFTKAFIFFYKHCSKVLKVLRILDCVGGNLPPLSLFGKYFFFLRGIYSFSKCYSKSVCKRMIFSRKQSKTKQSKVQMGVWLLKVIYNTGRKREESFFTLQPSCPPQCLILAYQVKETRGILNLEVQT